MASGRPFSNGEAFDAVVVGAGPAGSTAALGLAAAGARVAILERAAPPRYKTCGGGVVARAVKRLPPGVIDVAERSCRVVELRFPDDGQRFVVERDEPLVRMTMRSELDHALLARARAAGAELRESCRFRGFDRHSGGLRVDTDRGAMWTRFLIGADGAAGDVARHAGWGQAPYCIPAMEAEVGVDRTTLRRFSERARFDLGFPDDGYAWIFPKRTHLSVGVLHMRRGRRGLRTLLSRYLASVGISRPASIEIHGSLIPVRPRPGGFSRGRVLLVGDSAGLADPVTGEGISQAIESGRIAAEALVAGGLAPDMVASRYRRNLAGTIVDELRFARPLALLLYASPRLRRFAFRRAGGSLCRAVADVIMGRRSYRRMVLRPGSYLRLLRRLASR